MKNVFAVSVVRPGLIALLMALTACGQKGPLTLPASAPAASAPAR